MTDPNLARRTPPPPPHRPFPDHRMRTALLLALATTLAAAPLGAQAPATAPAAAPAAAAQPTVRPVRQSWTSARRSFATGDIVTVYIDEYTLAAANTSNSASDRKSRDLGIDARISTGPGAATNINADIGTDNNADSRQRGEALRQNRFQSEMSVRVVAVDPASGLLQIKGTKLVNLDKNRQEVTLTGWVRPQDVSAQNAVESSRIADAELVYTGKGNLGKPKTGILGRVLGMVWP